ncbi:hypothetical protein HK101_004073, partial [Irineochytrium annulatum]
MLHAVSGFAGTLMETAFSAARCSGNYDGNFAYIILFNEINWIVHESSTVLYSYMKTCVIITSEGMRNMVSIGMGSLFLIFAGLRANIGRLRFTQDTLGSESISAAHSYAFIVWGTADFIILCLLVYFVRDHVKNSSTGSGKGPSLMMTLFKSSVPRIGIIFFNTFAIVIVGQYYNSTNLRLGTFNSYLWLCKGAYPAILLLDVLMTKSLLIEAKTKSNQNQSTNRSVNGAGSQIKANQANTAVMGAVAVNMPSDKNEKSRMLESSNPEDLRVWKRRSGRLREIVLSSSGGACMPPYSSTNLTAGTQPASAKIGGTGTGTLKKASRIVKQPPVNAAAAVSAFPSPEIMKWPPPSSGAGSVKPQPPQLAAPKPKPVAGATAPAIFPSTAGLVNGRRSPHHTIMIVQVNKGGSGGNAAGGHHADRRVPPPTRKISIKPVERKPVVQPLPTRPKDDEWVDEDDVTGVEQAWTLGRAPAFVQGLPVVPSTGEYDGPSERLYETMPPRPSRSPSLHMPYRASRLSFSKVLAPPTRKDSLGPGGAEGEVPSPLTVVPLLVVRNKPSVVRIPSRHLQPSPTHYHHHQHINPAIIKRARVGSTASDVSYEETSEDVLPSSLSSSASTPYSNASPRGTRGRRSPSFRLSRASIISLTTTDWRQNIPASAGMEPASPDSAVASSLHRTSFSSDYAYLSRDATPPPPLPPISQQHPLARKVSLLQPVKRKPSMLAVALAKAVHTDSTPPTSPCSTTHPLAQKVPDAGPLAPSKPTSKASRDLARVIDDALRSLSLDDPTSVKVTSVTRRPTPPHHPSAMTDTVPAMTLPPQYYAGVAQAEDLSADLRDDEQWEDEESDEERAPPGFKVVDRFDIEFEHQIGEEEPPTATTVAGRFADSRRRADSTSSVESAKVTMIVVEPDGAAGNLVRKKSSVRAVAGLIKKDSTDHGWATRRAGGGNARRNPGKAQLPPSILRNNPRTLVAPVKEARRIILPTGNAKPEEDVLSLLFEPVREVHDPEPIVLSERQRKKLEKSDYSRAATRGSE